MFPHSFKYDKPFGPTAFVYHKETQNNIEKKILETGKFTDPKKVTFKPTNVKASGSIIPAQVNSMEELVIVTLPNGKTENWKVIMNPGTVQGPLTAKSATLVPKR